MNEEEVTLTIKHIPKGSRISFEIKPPKESNYEWFQMDGLTLPRDTMYHFYCREKPKKYE